MRSLYLFMLLFVFTLLLGVYALTEPSGSPPINLAKLSSIEGTVWLSHLDLLTSSASRGGELLSEGSIVRTEKGSAAQLVLFDGRSVKLAPQSELILHHRSAETPNHVLELKIGMMEVGSLRVPIGILQRFFMGSGAFSVFFGGKLQEIQKGSLKLEVKKN